MTKTDQLHGRKNYETILSQVEKRKFENSIESNHVSEKLSPNCDVGLDIRISLSH